MSLNLISSSEIKDEPISYKQKHKTQKLSASHFLVVATKNISPHIKLLIQVQRPNRKKLFKKHFNMLCSYFMLIYCSLYNVPHLSSIRTFRHCSFIYKAFYHLTWCELQTFLESWQPNFWRSWVVNVNTFPFTA